MKSMSVSPTHQNSRLADWRINNPEIKSARRIACLAEVLRCSVNIPGVNLFLKRVPSSVIIPIKLSERVI